MSGREAAVAALMRRRAWRWAEVLPWVAALAAYFLLPDYLQLGTQILVMILFALSLDLLLGYTGIVTLGHAAFFGLGAYAAGLLAVAGWHEPLSGLVVAAVASAVLGLVSGYVILRTSGLALLMLGMAITLLLYEVANSLNGLTGGADGLSGVVIAPLLGRFGFDMYGRTSFLYALAVLLGVFLLVRRIVGAPFGRSLVGIRQSPARMQAMGVSVFGRRLAVFVLSAGLAGLAGGLSAQTSQFVSLDGLSFDLSGTVLLMLVLGGPGRLYGAFIGAAVLMIAQDGLAKENPVFWLFWLGLFVILLVVFVPGGLLGLGARLSARGRGR